jgi:hypothetical protein
VRILPVVLIVLLVTPAVARADWGPVRPLSPADGDTSVAGLAVDRGDRPSVLLEARTRSGWSLRLRRAGRDGRLGAPVQVAATRNAIEGAGLFAGPGSDLVAGWLEIVNGSRRPVVATGPRLADRQVLAPGPRSTQFMRMAANRRGDAVVAFWRYEGQLYSVYGSYRPAGGRFEPPQLLATGQVSNPAVAIDQGGAAAVTWVDRAGAHVAERRTGASAFDPAAVVPEMRRAASEPAVAIEDGRVVVSWIVGAFEGPRTVLVAERPSASAPFTAPAALSAPGVRIPHWISPSVSLVGGQALVAWVQGVPHTTVHDRAALAIGDGDGAWSKPILRGAAAPRHVYYLSLLGRAPGRPPILAMTTSRAYRFRVQTATLRGDATLAPTRSVPTGDVGFHPWLAQGPRHAWLAVERTLGSGRGEHRQALLFRSS